MVRKMTPKLLQKTIDNQVEEMRAGKITSKECSDKIRLLNHIYGKKLWTIKKAK